jgi:hypothetical protein
MMSIKQIRRKDLRNLQRSLSYCMTLVHTHRKSDEWITDDRLGYQL